MTCKREKGKCPEGSRRLSAAVHSDNGVCLAGEGGEDTGAVWGLKLVFILTIEGYAVCLAGEGGEDTSAVWGLKLVFILTIEG